MKKITKLTGAQKARFDEWADKWIEIGLRTGNADRPKFEKAVRECYRFAGLEALKVIVWTTSPLAAVLAGPIAALLIEHAKKQRRSHRAAVGGAVRDAVGAVSDAVSGAVSGAVRGAVGAVDDAVSGAVGGAVSGAVDAAVSGAVGAVDDAVSGAVGGAVSGAVDAAVSGAVRDAVSDAVSGAVRDAVSGAVSGAVRDAVSGAVRDAVSDAVSGAVSDAVSGAVSGAVRDAVRDAVKEVIRQGWASYLGGQFWVSGYWWGGAWTSYFREVCDLELSGDLWDRALAYEATMESACWWYAHRDFVIVSERPTVIHCELVDPERPRGLGSHRLHCEDGPAVGFQDGWGVWAWHGVRVTKQIIEQPESITIEQVRDEENAEVRRVMVERMGWDAFCAKAKMRVLHIDELNTNFPDIPISALIDEGQRLVTSYRAGTERAQLLEAEGLTDFENRPLRFVRLADPSTGREYTIRVKHDHVRCYEAVGWTFGLSESEYKSGKYLRQGDVFLKPLSGGPLQQQHS